MDKMLLIEIDGDVYSVVGNYEDFIDGTKKLKKDQCCIRNGIVYIFGGKQKAVAKPGHCYRKEDGDFLFVTPIDPTEQSTDRVFDSMASKAELTDPKKLKESSGASQTDMTDLKIFAPPIEDGDDDLKKIVKTALISMQFDPRLVKHMFNKDYGISNLRASITKKAPLSKKYFDRWVEVLGLKVSIHVEDDGNPNKPIRLEEPIQIEMN